MTIRTMINSMIFQWRASLSAVSLAAACLLSTGAAQATTLKAADLVVPASGSLKVTGNINQGKSVDLKWASKSNVARFPATQREHFSGRHVLYRLELPARSVLQLDLTPKQRSTDLSLYAYQVRNGDKRTRPPKIFSVTACEASAGSKQRHNRSNPGQPERVELNATTNSYTVYVGVAGAGKAASGAFALNVSLKTAPPAPTGKIKNARNVQLKANSVTKVRGKLRKHPPIPLSWAANSSVACFPATRNQHFNGSHKLYRVELPPKAVLNVTATPKGNRDISLYAYQVRKGDTKTLPPEIHSVVTCEASYGTKSLRSPFNPGKAEQVRLNSIKNPYTVYVGVAGAQKLTEADFELSFDLKVAAPAPTGKITRAENISLKPNGVTQVTGKLKKQPPIPLGWAANSSVACFPATRNQHFNGSHKLYRVELPSKSELEVTATPRNKQADISLYAYQVRKGDTKALPPNIHSVVTCEASYGTKSFSTPFNPGGSESVRLNAIRNPYTVYVGVAGAKGLQSADFALEFKLKTAGPRLAGQITQASRINVTQGQTTKVGGKLEGGPQIDLAWAANSSVACFPATKNQHFNGAHQAYVVDLPSYSELTAKLVPANKSLDLSLYAYSLSPRNATKYLPPNVPSVVSCEASAGSRSYSKPFNPGDPESVSLIALRNPYSVIIGVTGAQATTAGAFTLEVQLKKR